MWKKAQGGAIPQGVPGVYYPVRGSSYYCTASKSSGGRSGTGKFYAVIDNDGNVKTRAILSGSAACDTGWVNYYETGCIASGYADSVSLTLTVMGGLKGTVSVLSGYGDVGFVNASCTNGAL